VAIFTGYDNKIVKINGSPSVPGILKISGFSGVDSVLFTSLNQITVVNSQFMPTLSRLTYAYSFGMKPARYAFNGLAFPNSCGGGDGIGSVYSFFDSKNMDNSGSMLSFAIGSVAARGFLTSLNITGGDARIGALSFNLGFTYAKVS
jgi:hypothetical protein